ncbi:His/Gly/Thr/Pro-type tRNA ligase C-terminal domain-containing protein [Thermodesulfobacteriota bacterium]
MEVDARDIGGARGWVWIKKGAPLRVEIGPRDMARNTVSLARRDRAPGDRQAVDRDEFARTVTDVLEDVQETLFARALEYRETHTRDFDAKDTFWAYYTPNDAAQPEIHGGFARAAWCGAPECEERIKEGLNVTIRLLPFEQNDQGLPCILCGHPGQGRVIFAKAY